MAVKKTICLTFDDGPNPKCTREILDLLEGYGAKATFFVVGRNVRKYPNLVRQISEKGHDIGNHTFTHPVTPLPLALSLEKEVKLTEKAISRVTGKQPWLFRPTWKVWDRGNVELTALIRELGYLPVRWSLSSLDWIGSIALSRRRLLEQPLRSREIILLHDGNEKSLIGGRKATVRVLSELLERYSPKDTQFVSLSRYFKIFSPTSHV